MACIGWPRISKDDCSIVVTFYIFEKIRVTAGIQTHWLCSVDKEIINGCKINAHKILMLTLIPTLSKAACGSHFNSLSRTLSHTHTHTDSLTYITHCDLICLYVVKISEVIWRFYQPGPNNGCCLALWKQQQINRYRKRTVTTHTEINTQWALSQLSFIHSTFHITNISKWCTVINSWLQTIK